MTRWAWLWGLTVISGCVSAPLEFGQLSGGEGQLGMPGDIPRVPEAHSHVELPDGRGRTYVIRNALMLEAPGLPARKLMSWDDGTSFVHVDPALRYVLLHEREAFDTVSPVPTLAPGDLKPMPGSRLTLAPLPEGPRRVIVPQFHFYDITIDVAPDGRTAAVRTALTRDSHEDARQVHLVDLESPPPRPWLGTFHGYRFLWAPKGLTLALIGGETVRSQTGLYVATPEETRPRLLKALDRGHDLFQWLPDGERVLVSWSNAKYEGVLHVAIVKVADGQTTERDIPMALSGPPGSTHVRAMALSPDGTRLLVQLMGRQESAFAVVDLGAGTWARLGAGAQWPHWAADGALTCRDAAGAPVPCPSPQ